MYLALLGFGMIVVFMALIMAKKLSPFTSLILIPIVFGLLAGYGWDTLEYAANGIINVASTFAMMTFAILYFGVMLTAGMFDPMVDAVVSWCKGDPLKVLVGTSVLAAFVSLDGDGTTTVMICCTAMLPIYERLHIKKIYLATLIILQNCIMNLIPWGGPTARVMSVMNLDAGEILAPLVPGMILGALYSVGVGYYLGLKERKRLGVTKNVEIEVAKVELSAEERAWKRPKMIFVNLILTAAIIVALVMGLASSEILFGVGTAIALLVNYPNQKTQRQVISSVAPDMINVVMMVLGAGVLMGVLDGPEGAGVQCHRGVPGLHHPRISGQLLRRHHRDHQRPRYLPAQQRRLLLRGAAPAGRHGPGLRLYRPADRLCRPDGTGLPFLEPPGPLHLPAHGQDRDYPGPVSGLHLQMVHRHLCDLYGDGLCHGKPGDFITGQPSFALSHIPDRTAGGRQLPSAGSPS